MARQRRFIVPDLPVHIVQRGNDRMNCFRSDEDRLVYLALIRQLLSALKCSLHAYCLMTNHVHLLLTPAAANSCGLLMKSLSHRYAQYFNKKHHRTGTLWEGRYRSCLVESAAYILACHRYIELNPVRAGLVKAPGDYAWSSYTANCGAQAEALTTPREEVRALERHAYEALLNEALEEDILKEIRESTNGGYPLASSTFKSAFAPLANRRFDRDVPGPKKSL